MTDSPFTLTDADRANPLWHRLSEHLTERLRKLRGRNDGPMSPEDTLTLRGKISELKEILKLGDDQPRIE